jgi:hypothetical protein
MRRRNDDVTGKIGHGAAEMQVDPFHLPPRPGQGSPDRWVYRYRGASSGDVAQCLGRDVDSSQGPNFDRLPPIAPSPLTSQPAYLPQPRRASLEPPPVPQPQSLPPFVPRPQPAPPPAPVVAPSPSPAPSGSPGTGASGQPITIILHTPLPIPDGGGRPVVGNAQLLAEARHSYLQATGAQIAAEFARQRAAV